MESGTRTPLLSDVDSDVEAAESKSASSVQHDADAEPLPQAELVDVLTQAVDGTGSPHSAWSTVKLVLGGALLSFLFFQPRRSFSQHVSAYHAAFTILTCTPAALTVYLCQEEWDVSVPVPYLSGTFHLSSIVYLCSALALVTGLMLNDPSDPTGFSTIFIIPTILAHILHLKLGHSRNPHLFVVGILLIPLHGMLNLLCSGVTDRSKPEQMRLHLAFFHAVGALYIVSITLTVSEHVSAWTTCGVLGVLLLRQIVWARLMLAAVDMSNGGVNLDEQTTALHRLLALEQEAWAVLIRQWCPCTRPRPSSR